MTLKLLSSRKRHNETKISSQTGLLMINRLNASLAQTDLKGGQKNKNG